MKQPLISLMIALLPCCWVAKGEYTPEVNITSELKTVVIKGTKGLKSFGKPARQAIIAEALGLLFMPKGDAAYSADLKTWKVKGENTRAYQVTVGSHFIGADGKDYSYDTAVDEKRKDTKKEEAWVQVKQALYTAGADAVLVSVKDDVTKMVKALAKRHLQRMPENARVAFKAVISGGIDGAEPIKEKIKVDGIEEKITVDTYSPGTKIKGKDGDEIILGDVMESLRDKNLERAWTQLLWCSHLIGKKDILSVISGLEKTRKK